MKTQLAPDQPSATETAKSITKVLEQSEHVEDLVKESAEELATVNAALKQEIAGRDAGSRSTRRTATLRIRW